MALTLSLPRLRKRIIIYAIVAALFTAGCLFAMRKLSLDETNTAKNRHLINSKEESDNIENKLVKHNIKDEEVGPVITKKENLIEEKERTVRMDTLEMETEEADAASQEEQIVTVAVPPRPNYNVHVFYYAWYGNPKTDGAYRHWNHQYLSHWVPEIDKRHRHGIHKPPDDIGANFYPALGPYSSNDPEVIHDHMKQMCLAGIGVIALSWYPPGKADDQGGLSDKIVPLILQIAHMYDMQVTLHIEPYEERNDMTLHDDVKYIIHKYSKHKAFYKYKHKNGKSLPLLYVYDSYKTPASDWANLLKPQGSHSVRNTIYDCVFIALMVEKTHRDAIEVGGFDGFYTYFATDGFTYGSSWRSWGRLATLAKQTNTLFIPSVGPGYIDTSIRPWNSQNTRPRQNGEYYKKSWTAALSVKPEIVTITSFNEWHEGTQIEKAVPKSVPGLVYKNYSPNEPDFYLKMTNKFAQKMSTS